MSEIDFTEGQIFPLSITRQGDATYFLCKLHENGERRLGVIGDAQGFAGVPSQDGDILLCLLSASNAAALRARLAWLRPVPLGRRASFGFGDRLGSATPGHIQAMRTMCANQPMAPIYAQQSVRENTRTGRTPQQVMDFAMWGVFQEGWRDPWGADADHVKVIEVLAPFVAAGYTFYTIDPSDHVDNEAQTDSLERLREKANDLPWDELGVTYEEMVNDYCQASFELDGLTLRFDEETLLRALVKYGRAVAHTLAISDALDQQMGGQIYDLEMSVDETDTPTSIHEHYFIANELLQHDIPVVSLAPRFVGKFQKGVDYMGDLAEFEAELARHTAILHHFDAYKLSVHTGSDKFSIYPAINQHAHGYVHVKTAGTSYLEALRVVAQYDPTLFRQMLALARERFDHDRKTYFIDARLDQVPADAELRDADLPGLFEQFDARQVLHVTFGSILDEFGDELHAFIASHEAEYRAGLEKHFARHLAPFCE